MSEAIKVEQPDVEVKADAETKPAVESKPEVETKPAVESNGAAQETKDISELSKEDADALSAKVAKQVYFYFSDSNLPIDRYFFTLTTFNKDGWVPIETILTFKRMREFQPYGVPFVVKALKEAMKEEGDDTLIAIDEAEGNVRRRRPLEPQSDAWTRSAYVKGFGAEKKEDAEDAAKKVETQEQLEAWFSQFGKINAVRMRREDVEGAGAKGKGKGAFKGSVFVEFAYEKEMTAFLESEEPKKYTEESTEEITKMTKDAYVKMKAKEKGIPDSEIHKGRPGDGKSTGKWNAFKEMNKIKSGGHPMLAKIPDEVKVVGKPTGLHQNDRDSRKRQRDDDEEEGGAKKEKIEEEPTFKLNYKGKDLDCDKATGKVINRDQLEFESDCVVKFTGGSENPDWKDLKAKIIELGIAKPFMAFPPGATVGNIAKEDDSKFTDEDLQKLNDAKLPFGGSEAIFSKMTDDEQRTFWHTRANYQGKLASAKFANENKPEKRSFNGGGRGGGGRGGGRGGRGGGGRGGGGRGRGGRGGRGGRDGGQRGDRNREKAEGAGMPPTVGAA